MCEATKTPTFFVPKSMPLSVFENIHGQSHPGALQTRVLIAKGAKGPDIPYSPTEAAFGAVTRHF